jgi:flagellar basal-body rod modification protein FlgD
MAITTSTPATANDTTRAIAANQPKAGSELDKNSFLKLLTAQMSNQDPTSSQDPSQYFNTISQMTMVEQLTNAATSLSESNAQNLLGKSISYTDAATGNLAAGTVSAISLKGSSPTLTVGDTTDIDLKAVQGVR